MVQVYYGFEDASGKQSGATISEDYNCQRKLSEDVCVTETSVENGCLHY